MTLQEGMHTVGLTKKLSFRVSPEKSYETQQGRRDRKRWTGMVDGLRNLMGGRRPKELSVSPKDPSSPNQSPPNLSPNLPQKGDPLSVYFNDGKALGASVLRHSLGSFSLKAALASSRASDSDSSDSGSGKSGKSKVVWDSLSKGELEEFLRIQAQYAKMPFHAPERQVRKARKLSLDGHNSG
eukprot:2529370-Rhodomonas_salina.1